MVKRTFYCIALLAVTALAAVACGGLKINIGAESKKDPLKEFTLEGYERGKVLVLQVRGFISDTPRKGLLADRASMVEEVVSQLRKAEKDGEIKAILLKTFAQLLIPAMGHDFLVFSLLSGNQ